MPLRRRQGARKLPPLPKSIRPAIRRILNRWLHETREFDVSNKTRDELESLGIEVQREVIRGEGPRDVRISYPLFHDDFIDRAKQLLALPNEPKRK